MDTQLRRGILDISVLAELNRGDSYGYQIIKDLEPYVELSESTLYPILKRLESANFVDVYSVEHNGRLRRYYQITNKGKTKIKDFLIEWKSVMNIYRFIEGGNVNE